MWKILNGSWRPPGSRVNLRFDIEGPGSKGLGTGMGLLEAVRLRLRCAAAASAVFGLVCMFADVKWFFLSDMTY